MSVPVVSRLWVERKGWSYPSVYIVDFPASDSSVFDEWYRILLQKITVPQRSSFGTKKVASILCDIKDCMEHFERNIHDANRAVKIMIRRSEAIECRLKPLLYCTIRQHIRLFSRFREWATVQDPNIFEWKVYISRVTELEEAISAELSKWRVPSRKRIEGHDFSFQRLPRNRI